MTLVRIPNQNDKSEEPGVAADLRPEVKDRVAEAYFGTLGPDLRRATQKRLHWVCEQVQGQTVLDIGCSQAITAILLAREGLSVTAIDIDPRTITDAQNLITAEPQHVMRNVALVNDDFLTHDFGPQRFETVLLAEVLEHLVNPTRFVERAYNLTVPNGRAIVTVPFGINDWLDHKHTFYLLEPYRLVSRYFEVTECVLLDRWIGFIGARRASPVDQDKVLSLGLETVTLLEKGFFDVERVLRDQVAGLDESFRDATKQYSSMREQAHGYKTQAADAQAGLKRAEQTAQALKAEIAALEEKLRARIAENENSREILFEKTSAYKDALHEAEKQQIRMEAELTALRGKVEETGARYQLALQKLKSLSLRLGKQAELAEDGEKALSEQKKRIAEVEVALKAEREKHEAQLSDLAREDEKREQELAAAKRELSERGKALETLQSRLALLEDTLAGEKSGREVEKAELKAKIEEQRGLLSDSAQRVNDIVASLDALKTVYDRDTAALNASLAQKERELGVAETALRETRAGMESAGREKAELALREEARLKELAVLTARLTEAEAQADQKQQELAALREEKERVEDLLNEQAAQYKEALQKYKSKESEKESSLKSAWQKLTMLEGQITGFKAKLTEAQGALATLGGERDALSARLAAAETEKAGSAEKVEGLLGRLKSAEESLAQERGRVLEADSLVGEARRAVAEKTALLEAADETIAKTRARVEELALQVERAVNEKSELERKIFDLEGEIGANAVESENLAARLAHADLALTQEKSVTAALIQQRATLAEQKESLEGENVGLLEALTALRGEMERLESEKLIIERQKTVLEGEVASLAQLSSEKEALVEEVDALTVELSDLRLTLEDERAFHGGELDKLGRDLEASRIKLEEALAQERAEGLARLEGVRTELTLALAMEKEENDLLLAEASDEITSLRTALVEEERRSGEADARVERVKNDLARTIDAQYEAIKGSEAKLALLTDNLELLRAAYEQDGAASRARINNLASALADSEARRDIAQERCASLNAEIEKLNSDLQTLGSAQMEEASIQGAKLVALEQKVFEAQVARENIFREAERSQAQAARVEERLTGEIEAKGAQIAALLEQLKDLDVLNGKVASLTADRAAEREALAQSRLALEEAESHSEMQSAKLRDQENLIEKLKLQALRSKKQINDLTRQVSQLNQGLLAAEHKVVKTKDTLSYQLGYKLIQGFKSFDKFIALPGELMRLRAEAAKRRGKKSAAQARIAMPQFTPRAAAVAPPVAAQVVGDLPRIGLGDVADLKSLKVACIMDEFTYTSYSPECNFLQLSPAHWRSELEAVKPDLLFIESAWRGKDSLWGAKVAHRSREVVEIVQWCNRQGIPTAFWNKEDPVHFETFLTTAKLFDHVFTTDIDCIARYKAALDHDRVYLLPFAAQPNLCNPVEIFERKDAFNFAGAYYVRYPERTADLCTFLDVLPEFRPLEIYDRNFDKNDPNYQFPEEYRPFIIGTLPFDKIDKAYKGYQYAINLNSIKNSQSMFARRVYELLASNTITVSNYSRGVRLMFGDLVVTSDSGQEVLDRLRKLDANPVGKRKFRLLALRKAMTEHTYEDRVAYLVSKIQGSDITLATPRVIVLAYIKSQEQFDRLLESFNRQNHPNRHFYGVTAPGIEIAGVQGDDRITLESSINLRGTSLGDLFDSSDWLAGMVSNDYYGENYLTDLALSTRYCDAQAFTKFAHYVCSESGAMSVAYEGKQYKYVPSASARASIIRATLLEKTSVNDWVTGLHTNELSLAETGEKALAIDEFNYCKNGSGVPFLDNGLALVSDAADIDCGVPLSQLIARAEATPAETGVVDEAPVWGGDELHTIFAKAKAAEGIKLSVAGNSMLIESELPDGKHTYYTSPVDFVPDRLGFERELKFFLDITPGLNVMFLVFFFDAQGKRIGEAIKPANRNITIEIPENLKSMRFGLRIYSGGFARLNALVLGHRTQQSPNIISRAETLVLTNFYPSYNALYRNAFVHSRVKGYHERGVDADVFCLRPGEALNFSEYSDIDIMTGAQEDLHRLLLAGNYKTVLVHFLDEHMWEVLKLHVDRLKINVWVHGAEVQPYHRREYNFKTDAEREAAKIVSDKRLAFWRDVLTPMHPNMKLIFVSQYFADEVMEDLGIALDRDRYTIIHNPIDTDLFSYEEKDPEQRKNILSIRPYAFPKYANDLSVKAILELSKKPWFRDLKFRLVGDGVLFDQILEPLHNFENVHIERRFLSQNEIADLHKEYGVFLTPTRMDAQGVSRDEAMSSGLVPITNLVAAIPEFVDESCGILVPAEDYHGIAEGIARLYEDAEYFKTLSKNAAERVRSQSSAHKLIAEEMALFTDRGLTLL